MNTKNYSTKSISFFLTLIIFMSSCASSTMLHSIPEGAKVYIDSQPAGTTPFHYSDTKTIGSATSIRMELEGYEPLNTWLTRNEEADVGAIIGGFIVLVPFLWTMKYHPIHTYELKPLEENNISIKREQINPIDGSKAEQLRELKRLLEEEIITKEEFESEKKKILDADKKTNK